MSKAIMWVKTHRYQWHRREYLRVFNICCYAVFLIMGVGFGIDLAFFQNAERTHDVVGLLTTSFTMVTIGVMYTLRLVDEHEKKLANRE